jgi:tripartite-type tricarboxylate transporter receptor subunit TctC
VAQKLTSELGQSVIVDNRPGASGLVGTEMGAKSIPDGYTLLLVTSTNAINVSLHPKLPYDFATDFDPVALIALGQQVLVVHPSVPARSTQEFVAYAKSKPGQLSYVSSGSGTSGHIAMEALKRAAGFDMVHVPHKGNAPALNDLVGGQVAAMFSNIITVNPLIKGGKLRALGVSGLQRSVIAPEIPTIAESGYPGFEVIAWFGVSVRAGTPKPIVDRLNAAIVSAVSSPELQERMLSGGLEPMPSVRTPQQFRAFLKADIAKWSRMIRESGIRPD